MLFILYTSGTTGKPKGIVHTTGGYLTHVASTAKHVFDLQDEDVFWCTADIGWVTGHSYVVYGPLANGATVLMYEGAPDWPERDRFWRIVERYGVTILYTAPTAIRAFMKWGTEHPERHDLSTPAAPGLRGRADQSGGLDLVPRAHRRRQLPDRGHVVADRDRRHHDHAAAGRGDHQARLGHHPLPRHRARAGGRQGQSSWSRAAASSPSPQPWPGMLRTIYGDDERYREIYWSRFPGRYFTGDGAKLDEDGYWWILGRVDDVLNVAGHRIGTMEVESALVDHPSVAEAAVVGRTHDLKGQALAAFVTLKDGQPAVGRAQGRAQGARDPEDRRHRPAGRHLLLGRPPEDPQREDHAPAAQGHRRRARARATRRRWRIRTW